MKTQTIHTNEMTLQPFSGRLGNQKAHNLAGAVSASTFTTTHDHKEVDMNTLNIAQHSQKLVFPSSSQSSREIRTNLSPAKGLRLIQKPTLPAQQQGGTIMQSMSVSISCRLSIPSMITALVAMLLFAFSSAAIAVDSQQSKVRPGGPTPHQVLDGTAQLVGHFDPNQKLRLVFGLQPPHMDEEKQFLQELMHERATKGSDYHPFLSAEEWNRRFAPSEQDEQAVVDWAKSQGFTVTRRYPNRLLVDVEAPAAVIEQALNVKINSYQLGGKNVFSNDRDPEIPTNLTGIVHSVGGLNNIQVLRPATRNLKEPEFPVYAPGPVSAPGVFGHRDGRQKQVVGLPGIPYAPTDIYSSVAYDLNALYAQGHCCNPLGHPWGSPPESSIAIATAGSQAVSDMAGFQALYPYLASEFWEINIDGTPPCCDGEGTMDLEWSTAWSNSFGSSNKTASVFLYDGANPQFSTFTDIYNQILTDGIARVFSTSWGCEELYCTPQSVMDTDDAIFASMVGQGWTLVAATGDQGATAGCANSDAVQFPSSDPNVVAAGGNTLYLNILNGSYDSEVGWTGGPYGCNSNDGGSTGGFSAYWGTPSYQSSLGFGSRAVPDIALNADWYNTPQVIFFNGSGQGNGGTSIVAPEMAGFFAQENAYLLSLGNICGSGSSPCAPMGNANYYLYDEGVYQTAAHHPFYDITSGCNNNDVTSYFSLPYYCAGSGFDEVTGWGSANMLQLGWSINWFSAAAYLGPSVSFFGPPVNHWYNTDQTVTWTVSDTGGGYPPTGVAGFTQGWDSIPSDPTSEATPGSGNSFYSGPQFPNATSGLLDFTGSGVSQGCHNVNVEGWNNMGVPSGDQTYGPLCYDTVPPSTTSSQSPAPNGYGWNNTTVRVTLTASDPGAGSTGSGVRATYYAVDNSACSSGNLGACTVYGGPFNITSQAQHTVYFFSVDNAGNYESQKHTSVNIDETAPVTTASLSGTLSGGIYESPVRVTLTATDNLSGFAATHYQVDGGSWATYSAPFTVSTTGSHTVHYYSTDKAGNVESTKTNSFTIKAPTSTTLTSSLNPSHHGQVVTFTATVTATFGGSPSGSVSFKDGSVVIGTGTINTTTHKAQFSTSGLTIGTHSITAVYAGNGNFVGSTSPVLHQVVN